MRTIDALELGTTVASHPTRKHEFNVHQLRVLQELNRVGPYGGVSRGRLAERIGYSTRQLVNTAVGLVTEDKREHSEQNNGEPYLSLLSLGLVVETPLDVDGGSETIVQITEYGAHVFEQLGPLNIPPVRRRNDATSAVLCESSQ